MKKKLTLNFSIFVFLCAALCLIPERAHADDKEIKISGKVVDIKEYPQPGVAVMLKGTTLGVATDERGMYSLVIPPPVR